MEKYTFHFKADENHIADDRSANPTTHLRRCFLHLLFPLFQPKAFIETIFQFRRATRNASLDAAKQLDSKLQALATKVTGT
jgi:hypothetical protein